MPHNRSSLGRRALLTTIQVPQGGSGTQRMLTGSGDKAGGDAVLSEQRYYQSLDDGRRIYDRGQAVVSVVDHQALGTAIRHGALDYRLAEDPRWRDEAVVDGPDGPYSRYYLKPTSAADLKRRRDLIALACELGGTIPP